tara:strand:+ start:16117 stop:16257 length:141 start_codon:yes stop_codon:yes gene_type:complete
MYNLCNEDILKLDAVTKRPVNEVFNWLSLSSEVRKEQERLEKYKGN